MAKPALDPIFSATDPIVLQGNFSSTESNGAPAVAASAAPSQSATPTPSPPAANTLFPARLFGVADTDATFALQVTWSDGNVGLITGDESEPKPSPYSISITPQNGRWFWEGRFLVKAHSSDTVLTLTLDGGQPFRAVLGNVWIMAGSPNLLTPGYATLSGGGTSGAAVTTKIISGHASNIAVVSSLPSSITSTLVSPPSDQTSPPSSSPIQTAPTPIPGSEPLLPCFFAEKLTALTGRPTGVYVVSRGRTLLTAWRLKSQNSAAASLWEMLAGNSPANESQDDTATPTGRIGARGIVFWPDEWEAERGRLSVATTESPKPAQPYASPSPATAPPGADCQSQLFVTGPDGASGIFAEVPRFLIGSTSSNGADSADDALKQFARILVQTQGCDRNRNDATRFPYGTSEPGWSEYLMPDSSWSRLRQAENDAVFSLHQVGLNARLVPSLPTRFAPQLPARWIWTRDDYTGFAQLAERIAEAAVDGVTHVSSNADYPPDIPIVNESTLTVTLRDAVSGPLDGGTAKLEVQYDSDSPGHWTEIPVPNVEKGELTTPKPQQPGKSPKITRWRYAWGDNPGQLHVYRIETKGSNYIFTNRDVIDAETLANKLRLGNDAVSKKIQAEFSTAQLNSLSGTTAQKLAVIVDVFNKVLGDSSFYKPEMFAAVRLSPNTLWLLADKLNRKPSGSVSESDRRRINRQLLEDAFPNELEERVAILPPFWKEIR